MWSEPIKYYACFLGVLAHEQAHALDEVPESQQGGQQDPDGDGLSTSFEVNTSLTDPLDKDSASGNLTLDDSEVWAYGPVQEAAVNSADTSEDWANPGTNYEGP